MSDFGERLRSILIDRRLDKGPVTWEGLADAFGDDLWPEVAAPAASPALVESVASLPDDRTCFECGEDVEKCKGCPTVDPFVTAVAEAIHGPSWDEAPWDARARCIVSARAALAAVAAAGRLIRSDAREPIRDEIAKWLPKASLDITHLVADGVLRVAAARPGEE